MNTTNEGSVGAGASERQPPSAEEKTQFAAALAAAQDRFVNAALAEDGMPVSAGWVSSTAIAVPAG